MISSRSRRRRARQFSGFLGSPPWIFLVPFLRLGICVFSLGGSWCFLRLEIFIFLFGFLKLFRNFNVRVCSVSCVIGMGSLVRAFFSCPIDPSLSAGSGVVPFFSACLIFFRPSDPPTQYGAMVWVIGPLNRGTGL